MFLDVVLCGRRGIFNTELHAMQSNKLFKVTYMDYWNHAENWTTANDDIIQTNHDTLIYCFRVCEGMLFVFAHAWQWDWWVVYLVIFLVSQLSGSVVICLFWWFVCLLTIFFVRMTCSRLTGFNWQLALLKLPKGLPFMLAKLGKHLFLVTCLMTAMASVRPLTYFSSDLFTSKYS